MNRAGSAPLPVAVSPAPDRLGPWARERDDLLHGFAGAFLFGAPLLYTMEVWWKGNSSSPARMLFLLAATYIAVLILDRATGFRASREGRSLGRSLTDGVEALAIGLIVAAFSLALLRQIHPDDGLAAVIGRIVLEAIPCSLGVGLANGLLRNQDGDAPQADAGPDAGPGDEGGEAAGSPVRRSFAEAGATAVGALILALAIAPTDEVPLVASNLGKLWLLALIAASLLVSYIIVYEADFVGGARSGQPHSLFTHPWAGTIFSYAIALVAAAVMLALFRQVQPGDPPTQIVSYVLVLGFPAALGGAAGRLAL